MKIAFCGDLLLRTPEQHKIGKELNSILKECEIRCVNFEVPVKPENGKGIHKSGPVHSQSHLSPQWAIANGFNLITLANNHSLDYGQEGLIKTLDSFRDVKVTGIGTYESAYNVTIIDLDGKKYGFLGFTHKEFGCVDCFSDSNLGTAAITSPKAFLSIVEAQKRVDKLYVIAHAGVERIDIPLPEWRELYKTFVDLGADGVIASHPHVPQGWEMYKGCPIVYSMGNFLFESGHLDRKSKKEFISLLVILDSETNKIEVLPLHYDYRNKIVEIDHSDSTQKYVLNLTRLLDDIVYRETFDKTLKELQQQYHSMMVLGGAYSLSGKEKIKNIIRPLFGKKRIKSDKVHLLNLFQCESHRWMMMRYLDSNKQNE